MSETEFGIDTVRITYSEESVVAGANPLLFNQPSPTGISDYTMNLQIVNQYGKVVTYKVLSIADDRRPTSSDSVWINTGGANTTQDKSGIIQTNPSNKG